MGYVVPCEFRRDEDDAKKLEYVLHVARVACGVLRLHLCSCPHYWHYYKCKHSLAMAIKNGDLEIPAQYRIDKIGKKRKAGRPKKAGGGQALAEKGAR